MRGDIFHTSLFYCSFILRYENEILTILREAGQEGLPLRRIALNVYNMSNTFFNPLEKQLVYEDVAEYLRKMSSYIDTPVKKMPKRGWYALNYDSPTVQQLLMDFSEDSSFLLD